MNSCASTLPWPCSSPTAGGTHPLGAALCPRHLAGILAPPRPPDIDRVALRVRTTRADWTEAPRRNTQSALDPETLAAIVALAPLGATVSTWHPNYPKQARLRMPDTGPGRAARVTTPDDPAVARTARAAAKKAASSGWTYRLTVAGDSTLLRAHHSGARVSATWTAGTFDRAWLTGHGRLEPLGYRQMLEVLSAHTGDQTTEGTLL